MKELITATNFRVTVQGVLSFLVVGIWAYVQFFLLDSVPPGQNHDLLLRMLGILDASLLVVMSFWFGTSSGSQAKDERKP